MSSWVPEIATSGKSWAERLADAIAADVASGRLSAGEQLPTQRALARRLGITTGTVNRGYAIAERAGLVSAEVGRGTFVARSGVARSTALGEERVGAIDLALNYPAGDEAEQALRDALAPFPGALGLAPYEGRPAHREAGARWLRHLGVEVDAERVLVSTSVQHGLAATLAACTARGDAVMTESLTSPGIKAVATMYNLRLVPVETDAQGLVPDALAASGAKVLYTMPTLHTPTTTTMPATRRRAIADVLQRKNILAIEDDAWGFLTGGRLPPLMTFAPDHVVYLTSFSKSLAPGIRVGYVVAPPRLSRDIASYLGTMTWAAPLMAELVSRWVEDGTAARIAEARMRTARVRQRLAVKVLGASAVSPRLPAFHLWLPLDDPWRSDELVNQAAALGVSVAPTEIFVPGRAPTPHAVRVCLGTEPEVGRVERGLRTIARIIKSEPRLAALQTVR